MKPMLFDPAKTPAEVRAALRLLTDDLPIRAIRGKENANLTVLITGNGPHFMIERGVAHVSGASVSQVLRALALLHGMRQSPGKVPAMYEEKAYFETVGLMFDMSRNGVMRPDRVKYLLRCMALMGYNLLMLYNEDVYEVAGQPYWGYMRGRYTQNELGELDTYARRLGIEMMPCIQTLGHLAQPLRWQAFDAVRDTGDIILADEPKTYELIEQLIDAASAPFRSRRIHVGMDEAHAVGQGRYKALFGEKPPFEIMLSHLEKVMAILRRRGLKPMMWSDMWFRLASPTGGYGEPDVRVPADIARKIPPDMQQVYWDYYRPDVSTYARMLENHRALGSEPVFAGGIWSYQVMWTNYDRSIHFTRSAMEACRRTGVREAFTTVWGDDGCENDMLSTLPALQQFADEAYNNGADDELTARAFRGSTGGTWETWKLGGLLDWTPGGATMRDIREAFGMPMPAEIEPLLDLDANLEVCNPAKYLLWQDPLLGLFDAHVRGLPLERHYGKLAARIEKAAKKNDVDLDRMAHAVRLARVLELKAELGVKLYDAYHADDRKALAMLQKRTLPELIKRVERLHKGHRELWMATFKPQGWEVLELRYAGLAARLRTAVERLKQYHAGRIDTIEELDEPRLPITDWPEGKLCYNGGYRRMISPSLSG